MVGRVETPADAVTVGRGIFQGLRGHGTMYDRSPKTERRKSKRPRRAGEKRVEWRRGDSSDIEEEFKTISSWTGRAKGKKSAEGHSPFFEGIPQEEALSDSNKVHLRAAGKRRRVGTRRQRVGSQVIRTTLNRGENDLAGFILLQRRTRNRGAVGSPSRQDARGPD